MKVKTLNMNDEATKLLMQTILTFAKTKTNVDKSSAIMAYCNVCIKFEESFEQKYGMKIAGYKGLLSTYGLLPTDFANVLMRQAIDPQDYVYEVGKILAFSSRLKDIDPENFKETVKECDALGREITKQYAEIAA